MGSKYGSGSGIEYGTVGEVVIEEAAGVGGSLRPPLGREELVEDGSVTI
jgi:hypothetical protein